jgi:hypothetical protein
METYDLLDKVAKGRYMEKIACVRKQDPYQIEQAKWRSDSKLFPAVTYVDLVNYLIFNPSPFYTLKAFENYKSLEAYDRFVCGWVTGVSVYIYDEGDLPVHVIRSSCYAFPANECHTSLSMDNYP